MELPAHADPAVKDAATYLAATLHALAREEHAGRRPKRLLEPGLATWQRFRGRLGPRDLAELLLEDAAVTQPQPFLASAIFGREAPLQHLPDALVEGWLASLAQEALDGPMRADIEAQAKRLGLATRPAFAKLHKLQAHHRVLELPGTGGRLAAYIAETQPDIPVKDVFTVACGSWQEETLAGLVSVGLGGVAKMRILRDADLGKAREAKYTHVFGLEQAETRSCTNDQIAGWFHDAAIVLI
jgi:hypothetical protein